MLVSRLAEMAARHSGLHFLSASSRFVIPKLVVALIACCTRSYLSLPTAYGIYTPKIDPVRATEIFCLRFKGKRCKNCRFEINRAWINGKLSWEFESLSGDLTTQAFADVISLDLVVP